MKYLATVFACLMAGWVVGVVVGLASFDPFDDYLGEWVFGCTIYFGTPIGLALAAVFLQIVASSPRSSGPYNQCMQLTDDARE